MLWVARYILLLLAIVFSGLSCLLLLSAKQISKNRLELADMRDRVGAVRRFQTEQGRLPNDKEFRTLCTSLPVRYFSFQYYIASKPEDCTIQIPEGWKSGGWVMWYWRGEWFEHYSSWDDYYTLAEQASWWGFCGIMVFFPFIALLSFALWFATALKR